MLREYFTSPTGNQEIGKFDQHVGIVGITFNIFTSFSGERFKGLT